jgi:hypothetical protein
MKKKIFIGIGVLVILLAATALYLNNRNRTLSPPGEASLTANGLTVSITYNRPSVRGRLIFGPEAEKALQPYGKYWRLGANESTEITFDKDIVFNDQKVKAGTYRMFAIPGPESFEIGLNSELGKWGYSEPDYSKDVTRTKVPIEKLQSPVELHTIGLKEADGGINVIIEWSDTRFVVPLKVQ